MLSTFCRGVALAAGFALGYRYVSDDEFRASVNTKVKSIFS